MKVINSNIVVKKLIGGVGALVMACAAAGAQATLLSDLVNGQTMTVDDKLFSDWTLLNNNAGGPAINLADIDVTGDAGDPLNPGIIFTASNGALSAVDPDFLLLNFGFKVSVTDPTMRIKDNTLNLDSSAVNGDGFISIEETVCTSAGCFPGSPDEIAFKNVFQDEFGGNFQDIQNFAPQTEIWVDKFVLVDGGFAGVGGSADIFQFSQYFSQEQITVDTPEPGTLALFALGLIGFGFSRRRAHR